jgi:hypothetical protein
MRELHCSLDLGWFEWEAGWLSTPEEVGLNQRPEVSVSTELGEGIHRIHCSLDMEEP